MDQCCSKIYDLFFFQNQRGATLDHRTLISLMEVKGPCTSVVFIFQVGYSCILQGNRDPARFSIYQ